MKNINFYLNNENNKNQARQKYYLQAEDILKFFLGTNDEIDTLITCKSGNIDLLTTDYDLYLALGSLMDYDNFNFHRLVKFLEVVDVISYREKTGQKKSLLKEEKVEELRKKALQEVRKK